MASSEAVETAPTPRSSEDVEPVAVTFLKGALAAVVLGAVLYGSHVALTELEQRKAKR